MTKETRLGLMAGGIVLGVAGIVGGTVAVATRRHPPAPEPVRPQLVRHETPAPIDPPVRQFTSAPTPEPVRRAALPPVPARPLPPIPAPAARPAPAPVVVGPDVNDNALVKEFFDGNPVDTDIRYKGKRFTVQGEVSGVYAHNDGTAAVKLGNYWIEFDVLQPNVPALRTLKTGDTVKMAGTCVGRQVEVTNDHTFVIGFTDARLIGIVQAGPGGGDFGSGLEGWAKRGPGWNAPAARR